MQPHLEELISLKDARNTILARYHYTLGLLGEALNKEDRWPYEQFSGQLNGLAFALGATNYKGELPSL